jgi:hypothetical protein
MGLISLSGKEQVMILPGQNSLQSIELKVRQIHLSFIKFLKICNLVGEQDKKNVAGIRGQLMV